MYSYYNYELIARQNQAERFQPSDARICAEVARNLGPALWTLVIQDFIDLWDFLCQVRPRFLEK